ncbi:MAG: hypothetical protein ACTS6J_07885 [Burkholderiales bacterium]
MSGSTATAEVKATVDVRPARSQVFLVSASIVVAIAVICGALLVAAGQGGGWVFLGFGGAVLYGAFKSWTKSQSDIDLESGHPTAIALPDGTNISTDSRLLISPGGLRGLVQVIDEVLNRRQLPEPDGLVDSIANVIIADSKVAAMSIANQINSSTQSATSSLIDTLGLSGEPAPKTVEQIIDRSGVAPDASFPQNVNAPSSEQQS